MRGEIQPTFMLRRKGPYGNYQYATEGGQWANEKNDGLRTGRRDLLENMQEHMNGTNRGQIVRIV